MPLARPLGAEWGHYGMWMDSGGTLPQYPILGQNTSNWVEPSPQSSSKDSVKILSQKMFHTFQNYFHDS